MVSCAAASCRRYAHSAGGGRTRKQLRSSARFGNSRFSPMGFTSFQGKVAAQALDLFAQADSFTGSAHPTRSRYRKAAICPRVQVSLGEKVVLLVPLVIFLLTAHATAWA